jgi:hypothetical protein
MMNPLRAIATVIGFAAVTATSGLALLTPHVTHADGEDRKGSFVSGSVYAYASFEKDDTAKGGWKIVIAAENPGDGPATKDFDIAIEYAVSNPNSRVGAPGQAVWHHNEKITVAAREKKSITVDCPANVSKQLSALALAQEKREALLQKWNDKGGDVPQWVWSQYNAARANYWVQATEKEEPAQKPVPTKAGQAYAKAKGKA